MAGANLIYGLGMLDLGMTLSFGQLVMDNEFARMIKHLVAGIPVNDDTLAVEHIKNVGYQNDFLNHPGALDYTLTRFKSLQSSSEIIDRNMRDTWELNGSKNIAERADEVAKHILKTYEPEPLSGSVLQSMRTIVEETENELGVR